MSASHLRNGVNTPLDNLSTTYPCQRATILHPPVMKTLMALLLTGLLIGCASTNEFRHDATVRPPTTDVAIFKNGEMPTQKSTIIAELTFLGPREDELRAQKRFIKRARALGGDALVFRIEGGDTKAGGIVGSHGGGWGVSTAYVFKGIVMAYQSP